MTHVEILPSANTSLAENKDDARRLRVEKILPALAAHQVVELDFGSVDVATQSFVHALISEAIQRYGEEAFDLLRFANCSDEIKQVVLTVFEYTRTAGEP